MNLFNFKEKLLAIGSTLIMHLPKNVSLKLASRGMVMVQGKINGIYFKSPLEPDGRGSHWFKIDENLKKEIKANIWRFS